MPSTPKLKGKLIIFFDDSEGISAARIATRLFPGVTFHYPRARMQRATHFCTDIRSGPESNFGEKILEILALGAGFPVSSNIKLSRQHAAWAVGARIYMYAHMHMHAHMCTCVLDTSASLPCGFPEPRLFQEASDSSHELGMMFSSHRGPPRSLWHPWPWVLTLTPLPPPRWGHVVGP